MAAATIHVLPDDSFDDWIVRDDNGCELGHYPTRETAEFAARAVARQGGSELVVHLPDGRTTHESLKKSWLARLFQRSGLIDGP